MSTKLVTVSTKSTKSGTPAKGTPAIEAPQGENLAAIGTIPAAPLAPTATYTIPGILPAKEPRAVGSFGPRTVPGVCLAAMDRGGATIAGMQELVAAIGLRGQHPVLDMLKRFAKVHGYTIRVQSGVVSYQAPALNTPEAGLGPSGKGK